MSVLDTSLAIVGLAAIAGLCQGLTGFGFALVFTPIAALLLPPREVVLAAEVIGGSLGALIVLETRRSLPWARCRRMIVLSCVAAPLGAVTLLAIDVSLLRIVVSVVAFASAIAFVAFRTVPIRHESLALGWVGAIGGFLNGCTSMGAPPAALLIANQQWNVAASRSTLATFNFASLLASIGTAMALGAFHEGSLRSVALATPAAIIGTFFGSWIARRCSPAAFRSALVGIVILTSATTLVVSTVESFAHGSPLVPTVQRQKPGG